MTDQTKARTATPSGLMRDLFDAIRTADSVQVHRVNALGCYDTYNFGPDCIAALNKWDIPDALDENDRFTAEIERLREALTEIINLERDSFSMRDADYNFRAVGKIARAALGEDTR